MVHRHSIPSLNIIKKAGAYVLANAPTLGEGGGGKNSFLFLSLGAEFMLFGNNFGAEFLLLGKNLGAEFMLLCYVGKNFGPELRVHAVGKHFGAELILLGKSLRAEFMLLERNLGAEFMLLGKNFGAEFLLL